VEKGSLLRGLFRSVGGSLLSLLQAVQTDLFDLYFSFRFPLGAVTFSHSHRVVIYFQAERVKKENEVLLFASEAPETNLFIKLM